MNEYPHTVRRDMILQILRDQSVRSQDELLKLLRRKGVRITQPTLSRDIHELGVAKTPTGYVLPTEIEAMSFTSLDRREEKLEQVIRNFVLSAEKAGTLVVVKTIVAAAQPVARALDEASLPEVVGTIGGDDTIFLATRNDRDATALSDRINATVRPATRRRPRA